MFPVSDDNTRVRTLPVVTYSLIALNALRRRLTADVPISRCARFPIHYLSSLRSEADAGAKQFRHGISA